MKKKGKVEGVKGKRASAKPKTISRTNKDISQTPVNKKTASRAKKSAGIAIPGLIETKDKANVSVKRGTTSKKKAPNQATKVANAKPSKLVEAIRKTKGKLETPKARGKSKPAKATPKSAKKKTSDKTKAVKVKTKPEAKKAPVKKAKTHKREVLSVIARRIQESKRIKPSKRFTEPLVYVCKRCKQSVQLYIPAKVTCSRCGKPMQIPEAEPALPELANAA